MRTNYEVSLAAMRVEKHIFKIDNLLTEPRPCPYCDSNETTVIHHLYRCPVAEWMWNTIRILISVQLGVKFDLNDKVIFQGIFPRNIWSNLSRNVKTLIHIFVSIARHMLFSLLYLREKKYIQW